MAIEDHSQESRLPRVVHEAGKGSTVQQGHTLVAKEDFHPMGTDGGYPWQRQPTGDWSIDLANLRGISDPAYQLQFAQKAGFDSVQAMLDAAPKGAWDKFATWVGQQAAAVLGSTSGSSDVGRILGQGVSYDLTHPDNLAKDLGQTALEIGKIGVAVVGAATTGNLSGIGKAVGDVVNDATKAAQIAAASGKPPIQDNATKPAVQPAPVKPGHHRAGRAWQWFWHLLHLAPRPA